MAQVYRHFQGGYWRASKRWCKQMPLENVPRALIKYADNEVLIPKDVYGGPKGAIAHLKRLESWFQVDALKPYPCTTYQVLHRSGRCCGLSAWMQSSSVQCATRCMTQACGSFCS